MEAGHTVKPVRAGSTPHGSGVDPPTDATAAAAVRYIMGCTWAAERPLRPSEQCIFQLGCTVGV